MTIKTPEEVVKNILECKEAMLLALQELENEMLAEDFEKAAEIAVAIGVGCGAAAAYAFLLKD